MIGLSPEERKPRVMVTMRCNFHCSFCSVTRRRAVSEISGDEWIRILTSQPYERVILTGGEPLLHPAIFKIINGLNVPIVLYTNLGLWSNQDLKSISTIPTNRLAFYISFHPDNRDDARFIDKVLRLNAAGFKTHPHYTIREDADPEWKERVDWVGKRLNMTMGLTGERDQRQIPRKDQALCHIDRTLLGPDGKRYPCTTKIHDQEDPIPLDHYVGIVCGRKDCFTCDIAAIGG